jgi:hypothetical protein
MDNALMAKKKELQAMFAAAATHFRKGEDADGLYLFMHGMDELEALLKTAAYLKGAIKAAPAWKDALRALEKAAKNLDIIGLTDALQYALCPLLENLWEEGGV